MTTQTTPGPWEKWMIDVYAGDETMPEWAYRSIRSFARQQDAERAALIAALEALDAVIHFDLPWHDDYGLRVRPAAMDAAKAQARAALEACGVTA